MDLHSDSVSLHCNLLLLISHTVQLEELPLLLIIVHRGHEGANKDGHQYCKAFNPRLGPLFSFSSAYLQSDGQYSCYQQYSKRKILECLAKQLKKSWRLFDFFLVAPKGCLSLLKL